MDERLDPRPGLAALKAVAKDAPPSAQPILHAYIALIETGLRYAEVERHDGGRLPIFTTTDDGDLIFDPPPCDEQLYRELFGLNWLYYWIAFGCWLP